MTTWREHPTQWRRTPRPRGWKRIRAHVLARDNHQCTWTLPNGQRCPNTATDVDHIGDPNDHTPDNLRALCHTHHAHRTALQANAARAALYRARRYRPPGPHPGLR